MSEVQFDTWKFIAQLYKNPLCSCVVYACDDKTYRVFMLSQEALIKELLLLCLNSNILYGFHGSEVCLIEPYTEVMSLADWMKEKHTIEERIILCRNLLFEVMHRNLPERLYDITLDYYSIGVNDNMRIALFLNPCFSSLLHPLRKDTVQKSAEMILDILSQGKEVHHLKRYEDPKNFLTFKRKVEQKDYHDYASMMDNLYHMETSFLKKKRRWNLVIKFVSIVSIAIGVIALCAIGIYKYIEWNERTYDGLPRIAEENMNP